MAIADATVSGILFVIAFALLFGGARITGWRAGDIVATLLMAGLSIAPYRIGLVGSVVVGVMMWLIWRKRRAESRPAST